MQPAVKLARQIRDALSGNTRNAPVESLAAEYARLCQEASQRLESCAAMLEKGSEYQALQLAETEPVLLDLIAALSFAEAPAWAAYCAAERLPVPPKFDSKAVQALDRIYARGISANHPLYKDYRAAVTLRDDAKAIQIIRSIVHLNPEDANAKSELARIENKLFQLKLQELRAALAQHDEKTILAVLSELERVAAPAKLAELPEHEQARHIHREAARREAIEVAGRLVEALDEERQAGAWRMAGDLLARIRALQSEHGFTLSETQAAKCLEAQQYFDAQRAAADETARFNKALAALQEFAGSLDSRLLARSTLSFNEAQDLHAELTRRWLDAEQFQRPIPEDLAERARAGMDVWRSEARRLQQRRRLGIIAAIAAVLIAFSAATWLALRAMRTQEYIAQLAGLQASGQVEAAEKMAAQIQRNDAALAAQPKLSARLDEAALWTRDERAKLGDIENRLADLKSTAKAGLEDVEPATFAARLESTNRLIEAMAGGLRAAPAGRMLAVRNQFEAHINKLREQLFAQAESKLAGLENLAGAKLGYDQPKEAITQALAEVEPPLKSLEARIKPALAALELPSSQQERVTALRRRAQLFYEELNTLANVHESILQASALDDYLQALAGYKNSRLSQTAEASEARKLLASLPKADDLLAGLLLPGDPAGWAAARADASGAALAPNDVLPEEISKLVALRDDPYLNDIWEFTFTDFRRKNERRGLYARGGLKQEGPNQAGDVQTTRWIGLVCDPILKTEVPAFGQTTYSLQRTSYGANGDGEVSAKRLSASSECLNRLELNRMTDAEGSRFERPLLRVFDELVHDKSANPLFKAYLMQQLGTVLYGRRYAWGLEYCASLRDDLVELNQLCEGAVLRSQDWLLERKRAQFNQKLAAFFGRLQSRSYLAEARLHREVVRAVLKAGLQFGGFIDSTGQARLSGEALGAKSLWALSTENQKLARYFAPSEQPRQNLKQQQHQPPAIFSPVFFVPLDPSELLAEMRRKASDQSGIQTKLPAIPWLESP